MYSIRGGIQPGEKIRILIVDDSVVIRRLISKMVEADPALENVGSARNGVEALAKIAQLKPHLVTLDVEMPELDGIGALREIVKLHPEVRVMMLSSLTAHGTQVTVESLMLGASDYIAKPQGDMTGNAFDVLGTQLMVKIKQLFPVAYGATVAPMAAPRTAPVSRLAVAAARPEILAIGVSTGGPSALTELLPMLPENFPLPIVIVQHMPPHFTKLLAERLTKVCKIRVVEGTEGMRLEAGSAIIAPGDFHMRVVRSGLNLAIQLNQEQQENSCRPAVDVLFRSIAETCKGRVVAAVLTGMGQDGLLGAQKMKIAGASILAQDRATSVVWGMPGAIVAANLADAVLPLNQIVPEILMRIGYR